jgi:hypothetical protein
MLQSPLATRPELISNDKMVTLSLGADAENNQVITAYRVTLHGILAKGKGSVQSTSQY